MLRGLLLLCLASAPSWACTCVGWPSTKGDWERSKLVFAGTVEKKVAGSHVFDFDNATIPHEDTYIRVTEAFKGVTNGEVVVLELVATSCGGYYEVGYQGLFFASGAKGGLGESGCDRTGPLESAAADLYFLRGLPQTARGRGVVGEVRLREAPEGPSRPMAGIKVIVTGARRRWETKTNAAGCTRFTICPRRSLRSRSSLRRRTMRWRGCSTCGKTAAGT